MPVYMVDRNLPGVTRDQLAAAQSTAIETVDASCANLPRSVDQRVKRRSQAQAQ